MDRKTIKAVIVTALILLAVFSLWQGVQGIRRGDVPGRSAAAYLDALIKLGQMPTGLQVEQELAKRGQAQAPALAVEPGPAPERRTRPRRNDHAAQRI